MGAMSKGINGNGEIKTIIYGHYTENKRSW